MTDRPNHPMYFGDSSIVDSAKLKEGDLSSNDVGEIRVWQNGQWIPLNRTQLWRGIHKLQEEINELGVVLSKLCACPSGSYYDGTNLTLEQINELSDVQAAINYYLFVNSLKLNDERVKEKFNLFVNWGLPGVKL